MLAKVSKLPAAFLALATAALLAFCLTGCGGQATSSSTAASGDSSAAQDVAFPEGTAEAAELAQKVLESDEISQAGNPQELPTQMDDEYAALESGDIETGIEDESKAPSSLTLLCTGGIQMLIPSNWKYSSTDTGWNIVSADGSISGAMTASDRTNVKIVDVEALALTVVDAMDGYGAKNIEVIAYETRYSPSGALGGARICVACDLGGETYVYYFEFIESKTYLNKISFSGKKNDFSSNLATIGAIADTVAYNPGEQI